MRNKYIRELINLIFICIGGIILVIGVNVFLKPAGVFASGLFGFSQELSTLIFGNGDKVNVIFWCINIPLIIFGFCKVGKRFLLRTILAVISISLAEQFIQVSQPIINNELLDVICGSVLMGLGIGLALSHGGSTGGTDIIATYVSIIKGKSFGMVNTLVNTIVIILAVVIKGNIQVGVYMLMSLYIAGIVIDNIHNINQKVTFFIVTDKKDEVVNHITNNFTRGVTVINSEGGYSKRPNNVIMVTISKREINSMAACVKQADPDCFINIYNVQGLLGSFKDNYVEML